VTAAFTRSKMGLDLRVRLTPNAASDELGDMTETADGLTHLAARVRAVPDKGKANKALCDLLAKRFDVAKSSVTIIRGATSRLKTVRLEASKEDAKRLTELLENLDDER
jgi:uncharacterized protein YggU (UPF0235/DUF167 family)